MKKLGTFNGVFIPSFEAILGAVLFLLLPHLVGEMGMVNMLLIVVVANLITTATAFSIGDCTSSVHNIGSGGMYAVSKRSLGKAFGGSIGIQLFLAQAASIGFYAIGFATPLQELLQGIPAIAALAESMGWSILVQKQLLGSLLALLGLVSSLIGADFVVKIQFIIFLMLSVAIGGFFFSPMMGLQAGGQPIFQSMANLRGAGTAYGFFVALTTFFPAVTGIDAGVGMSGLLKTPKRSLFRGTFIAIAITFAVYAGLAIVFSFINPSMLVVDSAGNIPSMTRLFSGNIILYVILMAGVMVATGSSALSYFVTAPRTAQALVEDSILPRWMDILKKDFKKGGSEPRFATLLTFIIAMVVVWSGDVNVSSRVVGIAFLVVYGWINLVAFFERVSGNPSFRPTRKVPTFVGLAGFIGSMTIIAMDSWWLGLIVLGSQLLIFNLILRYKAKGQLEGVWWGLMFSIINWGMHRLKKIIQGTKNWRPLLSVFVFGDQLDDGLPALRLARRIADFKGMVSINVIPGKNGVDVSQLPDDARIVDVDQKEASEFIPAAAQLALPSGLSFNSVLLSADTRLHLSAIIEKLIEQGKNVMVYQHGPIPVDKAPRLDLWWKGEDNGNLMALLAYIIVKSDEETGIIPPSVRLVRRLEAGQSKSDVEAEMHELLDHNNISAELLLLEEDENSFVDVLHTVSSDASLILVGMPGKKAGQLARMFKLDKLLFERELDHFKELPPVLFVKAAGVMELMEE